MAAPASLPGWHLFPEKVLISHPFAVPLLMLVPSPLILF